MANTIFLTGITTTGTPHLGNYVGAIRPAIQASHDDNIQAFYFLADYHALIKVQDPQRVRQSAKEVAATWLALGLNTEKAIFYRQSAVPEITELNWLLTTVTAKGLMNRAHAYKAVAQINETNGNDPDFAVTMGLFSYPILMAADILMFNAHKVPVGRDQIQHLEMARDIAARFNHFYGEYFVLPEAVIDDNVATLTGLDGRKMSKSYDNVIPLFAPEKELRKLVMRIKTNSQLPEEPKNPDECGLFSIFRAFATATEVAAMRDRYLNGGLGWGEMKQALFDCLNRELSAPREKYQELIQNHMLIETALREGAEKARDLSIPFLAKLRQAVGIDAIH